jgi:hypothetical protein
MLGVFAFLASAGLVSATAQQDAADRQRMVEEIDAMLASAPAMRGVAELSPPVRAALSFGCSTRSLSDPASR